MKYNDLYSTLEPEFADSFKDTETTYFAEFNSVYNGLTMKDITPTESLIRNGLLLILEVYSSTEATTKEGGFFRWVADLLVDIFGKKSNL